MTTLKITASWKLPGGAELLKDEGGRYWRMADGQITGPIPPEAAPDKAREIEREAG
ncbi:MAG: hypothetical protein ACRDPY_04025 [Streptosporangiaceae bacterium]